jgi:putative acetyltransferase
MTIDDYDAVMALWRRTEGLGLDDSDSHEAIAAFLRRNRGMSQVACAPERIVAKGKRVAGTGGKGTGAGERIVGAVLCGYDGRRGMLYHLAVAKRHRRHGLGQRLVDAALARLHATGCGKCLLVVLKDNQAGRAFWKAHGWETINGWVDLMARWVK